MSRKLEQIEGRTVLVVEDRAMLALDLTLILQTYGATVIGPSGSVTDALGRIEETPLDGAILDVDLHGQSVGPVADRLGSLSVPFILYYGHEVRESADHADEDIKSAHKYWNPEKLVKRLIKRLPERESTQLAPLPLGVPTSA